MSSTEPGLTDVDIASSLSQMAETTTTAELVRRQGQTKQVKVLSQRKLMEWIGTLLAQQMAGREDVFSDQEKAELLAKTQAELAARIDREKNAEKARAKAQAELDALMAQMANSARSGKGDNAALEELKARLEQAEQARAEAQQDTYELEDQLKEKLALLSATIAEKDKLRDSLRGQMRRATGLVEGVLGLDDQYYGNRHSVDNPPRDDLDQQEQFYHDYDVGAKIIQTLSKDLARLRAITAGDKSATRVSGEQRLLAQDLELLSKLKTGSLNAIDVAEPIAGLIEALEGARAEHAELQSAIAIASGVVNKERPLSEVPEPDGEPAQVLAEATRVIRELGAEAAKQKTRVQALKRIADDADVARNQAEEELEILRKNSGGGPTTTQIGRLRVQLDETQALMKVAQTDADRARLDVSAAKARLSDQAGTDQAVQMLQKRLAHALDCVRQLGAALSQTSSNQPSLEEARADLEQALNQVASARSPLLVQSEALDGLSSSARQITDRLTKPASASPATKRTLSNNDLDLDLDLE